MFKEYDKFEKNDKNKIPPSVMFIYTYKDIDKIIKVLNLKRDVIVNVTNMDKVSQLRVIDFLSGYIYANNGKREKLEETIFLFRY